MLLSLFVLLSPSMPCHCEHNHQEQHSHELADLTDHWQKPVADSPLKKKETSPCLHGLHCAMKVTLNHFHFVALQSVDFKTIQLPHYQRLLSEVYPSQLLRPPSSYFI